MADILVIMKYTQEHSDDVTEAVNAYFNEGDRLQQNQSEPYACHGDMMDLDKLFDPSFSRPMGSPVDILDASFVERAAAGFFVRVGGPKVTDPREVRQIPIEAKESNSQTISSGKGPVIENVTQRESSYGPEVHGAVVIDEGDDNWSSPMLLISKEILQATYSAPTVPPLVDVNDYKNDTEAEMLHAKHQKRMRKD
nr:plant UBX domain-containing protein 8-like isoform X1 [Lolium perenne]